MCHFNSRGKEEMFFFVLLINMMRFVSQTTFRQFPSLLLNGTCGSRLWPTQRGEWFPSPTPRRCWREGRAGGQTDGQSSRLVGSWLPALCAPSCLPVPFVTSATSSGSRWSQDVIIVTVILIGWSCSRLRGRCLGLLLLLHSAAQGQDAVV